MTLMQANALLDGAGYTEKDADGFRVWPGTTETISFTIEGTAMPGEPTRMLFSKW